LGAVLGGIRCALFGGALEPGLGADFDADFFDDFRAIRLPFVAFRRSKG
jgi:hypothetical protein